MNLKTVVFGLLILLSFTGCVSTLTPEDTVSSAKSALEKGDIDEFRNLLIGRAKAEFGRVPAYEGLRGYLKRFNDLDVVPSDVMTERKVSEVEYHTGHLVLVKSGRTIVLEVGVTCVDRFDFFGRAPTDKDIISGLESLHWDAGDEARNIGREERNGREWNNDCRIHSIEIK